MNCNGALNKWKMKAENHKRSIPIEKSHWIDTEEPDERQMVQVRTQDHRGIYVIPFAVQFKDDGWFNSETGEALGCFVAEWRPLEVPVDTP